MSNFFTIYDDDSNTIIFTNEEATEMGTFRPRYLIEQSEEKTSGGQLRQQIRPGVRFAKTYSMQLTSTRYSLFLRMYTNNSANRYIEYVTVPLLLSNDVSALVTNNFKVVLKLDDVDATYGDDDKYSFMIHVFSSDLM